MTSIKIDLKQEYKSFPPGFETTLDGDLIIITGVNGSGKSQLFDLLRSPINHPNGHIQAQIFKDKVEIIKQKILYRSFKDGINLGSLSADDANFKTNQAHIIFTAGWNYQEYDQYIQEFKRLTGKENFRDEREVKELLAQYPDFVLQVADLFDYRNLSSLFLTYALERQAFQAKNRGKKSKPVFEKKKEPYWYLFNRLFEETGFDYRFADDYELDGSNIKGGIQLLDRHKKPLDFGIESLSDGEKAIFGLIVSAWNAKISNTFPALLLLDEYDATFNPSLTEVFYRVLIEFYINNGTVVIVSTHNPITATFAPHFASIKAESWAPKSFETTFYEMYKTKDNPQRIVKKNHEELYDINEIKKALTKFYPQVGQMQEKTKKLEQELGSLQNQLKNSSKPLIICEGKTDWKHLKKAKECLKLELDIEFWESQNIDGNGDLKKFIEKMTSFPQSRKIICVFDSDDDKINKDHSENEKSIIKEYGANVYSFVIPNVVGYEGNTYIELYYNDTDLKKEYKGRRLYFDDEISEIRVQSHKSYSIEKADKISQSKKPFTTDLDKKEFKTGGKLSSKLLSKEHFAQNILDDNIKISDQSWENFRPIFQKINEILTEKNSQDQNGVVD